jgi:hypothetical protein
MITRVRLASLLMAIVLVSCTTQPIQPEIIEVTGASIHDYRYPITAPVLVEKLELALQTVNPPIALATKRSGRLESAWFPVPGRYVGLLLWRKEVLAQARIVVVVTRSFDDPMGSSSYDIGTQIRERHNENYEWEEFDDAKSLSHPSASYLDRLLNTIYKQLLQWRKK